MNRLPTLLLIAALLVVPGCSNSNPPKCSLKGATTLADPMSNPWPRFRFDMANSGHTSASLAGNDGRQLWSFTLSIPVSIESSPVVGMGQIVFGSSDGQFHVLDANGVPNDTFTNNLNSDTTVRGANTAGALLGANGNLFLATGDGRVLQTDPEGNLLNTASLGGSISASPNIGDDGEVYVGSLSGTFAAVCPNGVPRFSVLIAPTRSSAAVVSDDFCADFYGDPNSDVCPRIIVGANDSQVSAFDITGRQQWAFFASAPIVASVVIEQATQEQFNRAFVADTAGRLFAISLTGGARLDRAPFTAPGPISASPALIPGAGSGTATTLYVADQTGVLTAVEVDTAMDGAIGFNPRVVFEAGAPINSSPAVATGGDAPVIIFGADDGFVYAVVDAQAPCDDGICNGGPNAGEACETNGDCVLLWRFAAGSPIGASSPAIDANGTVYIGTQGGTLFAIGGPAATSTPSPTSTPGAEPTTTPESRQPASGPSGVRMSEG